MLEPSIFGRINKVSVTSADLQSRSITAQPLITTARLLITAALLIPLSCSGDSELAEQESSDERPNLILISLDTMRADRLSHYGLIDRKTTPVLDRLAEQSAVFSDVLATSTVTGPSHLSMFTGQYPERHGLLENGERVEPHETLASRLAQAGWLTAGFTGGGYLRESFGLAYGFETYRAKGGPLAQFKRTFETSMPHALEWLKSRPDGPFFLFLHGYDPHCPYEATPEGLRHFNAPTAGPFDPTGMCGEEHFLPLVQADDFDEADHEYLIDLYDALVYSADASLKPLIFFLRKSGLLDKSILVFTSDHGEGLGEHGWIGHGRLWDEQARVPLFIRFPDGKYAGDFDQPVSLVDLLPTLLDALGLEQSSGTQGHNLMPIIRSGSDEALKLDDRLRIVSFKKERAVQFGNRWKLGFEDGPNGLINRQLFDLREDPNELRNLKENELGAALFEEELLRYKTWQLEQSKTDARYRILVGVHELDAELSAELDALGYGGDAGEDQ
ncbi:MAG: arylsulfatase A-like enzyme [Planctomycetota bacterium]